MKDLSIISVGYMSKDKEFVYGYKHTVNWINLEISDNLYQTNIPMTIINEDGNIKESYLIQKTTKELIYSELETLLISKYYEAKHNKEFYIEDKIKLRELKTLKKYYEKYIDKQKLITSMYIIETSKKMKELNIKSYVNKEFNKTIILDTYQQILQDINSQINEIEFKSKQLRNKIIDEANKKLEEREFNVSKSKKENTITYKQLIAQTFKKITLILKNDYEKQKVFFKSKEKELKKKIKEYDSSLKDNSQLKNELQILKRNYQKKNLTNFREKAKNLLFENGIQVNDKH